MGAETRFAVVLFGSLILWLPALSSVLAGELDAGAGLLRYVIGAAFVWAMVAGLNQLVSGYAVATVDESTGSPEPEAKASEASGDGTPRRRTEDLSGEEPKSDPAGDDVDSGDSITASTEPV